MNRVSAVFPARGPGEHHPVNKFPYCLTLINETAIRAIHLKRADSSRYTYRKYLDAPDRENPAWLAENRNKPVRSVKMPQAGFAQVQYCVGSF